MDEIYITETSFLEGFEFNGMGKSLKKITLPLSPKCQGVLRIIGWAINEAVISGVNQDLKLIFKKISVKRLSFNDFVNYGELNFDRCVAENEKFKRKDDPDSSIIAVNTELGKAKFTEFDFKSFDFINFSNVSFDNIEASNVKWFEENQLQINGSFAISEIASKRKREIFRQIKQSLKKKGNYIDSLTFQSLEMQSFSNELKYSPNILKWEDKLIMLLNTTNNYGLSWWKPTKIILLITFLIYLIILPITVDNLEFGFPRTYVEGNGALYAVWNNLNIFWQMFNPARRISIVYGDNISGAVYFLDMIHRLILGIFIYQIIRAFRKFVSK